MEAVNSGKAVTLLFFVISTRSLTESGTKGYCISYHVWELLEISFIGLKVILKFPHAE